MAQDENPHTQHYFSAPPVPPRNPLREKCHLLLQSHHLQAGRAEHAILTPIPMALWHLGKVDCGFEDMQLDDVNAQYVIGNDKLTL
jgi:hypothetical protein